MLGKRIIISSLFIIVLFSLAAVYFNREMKNEKIHRGVNIEGISVENLTKLEAIEKIEKEKEKEKNNLNLKFILDEKEYSVSYRDLGFKADVKGAVDKAYKIGRSNNVFANFFNIVSAGAVSKNVKIEESFNPQDVAETINNLVDEIYLEPQNASISYTDGSFVLSEEKEGRYIDSEKLKDLINSNLRSETAIEIPVIKSKPLVTTADFEGIDDLLVEFSTDYSKSIQNRKDNIALGASFFDGMLVKPEEEVSFNGTVGDISVDTGFKEAGVIVNGEFDNGIGGGICQVSTTLYNALIRSDLEVVERYNHSRPISYVPLGTDAAVVQGYKDLKFRNNTNHNIYIKSFTDGNELKFQIFGNRGDRDYEVEIIPKLIGTVEPKVIQQYSTEIKEGESIVSKKGAQGYSYTTYKEIIKNGEVVLSEQISKSNYIPQDRVVIIGEGKADESKDEKSEVKKETEASKEKNKETVTAEPAVSGLN